MCEGTTMLLWNEIDYKLQVKVLELIEDTLLKQTDIALQDGLVAAMNELELWDNSPCSGWEEPDPFPFIAQATEQDFEK